MADERSSFYRRVLEQLLDEDVVRRDMSVLVVAGGQADRDAFDGLGFEEVTISNVDEEVAAGEVAPYEWSFQEAEALTYRSEREVEKTVASFAPHARHKLLFVREFELPEAVCWWQANLFAFLIEKPRIPGDLQSWLRVEEGELLPDPEVVRRRYGAAE